MTLLLNDDLQTIKEIQNCNEVYKFLKRRDELTFEVGDILISQYRYNKESEWNTRTVSHVSKVPKRYKVIYKDDFGICYIKALTSKGIELPCINAITHLSDYERYIVDPNYVDHVLLFPEKPFDPALQKKKEKKEREKIIRKNKALGKKITNIHELKIFLNTLNKGNKLFIFWSLVAAGAWNKVRYYNGYSTSSNTNYQEVIYIFLTDDPNNSIHCSPVRVRENDFINPIWAFITEPYKYEAF